MRSYEDLQQAFLSFRREHGVAKAHELIREHGGESLDQVPEENWSALIAAFSGKPRTFAEIAPAAYARLNATKKPT